MDNGCIYLDVLSDKRKVNGFSIINFIGLLYLLLISKITKFEIHSRLKLLNKYRKLDILINRANRPKDSSEIITINGVGKLKVYIELIPCTVKVGTLYVYGIVIC